MEGADEAAMNGRSGCVFRKNDLRGKSRNFSIFSGPDIFKAQLRTMLFGYRFGQRQAQPRSACRLIPGCFESRERFEHARDILLRNARPAVIDR